MKKCVLKVVFAFLILLPVCVFATDKTFTSNGSIVNGEVFNIVQVQNNGTIVNMSGGQTNALFTFNSSIFNMSNGQITNTLITSGSGTFNFSGGTITATSFQLGGAVNISGGTITGGGKFATPVGSVVNITDGILNLSDFMVYGETNIYGGVLNIDDFDYSGGITSIYGYGFNYDSVGQVLTGYLSDNNPFTINQVNSFDFQHVILIPEPISLLLFGFGLLSIRKTKRG